MTAIRTIDQISDDELEDCYDGTTNNNMVRRLVKECLEDNGLINVEDFGHYFAREIEGFIAADEEEEPDEWEEAWGNNCTWGETIAENINDALSIEEPEEYKE